MKIKEQEIDIQELRDFFFRASTNGYASGKEAKNISTFHGAKGFFWYEQIGEKYHEYSDIYFELAFGKSFGFTLISVDSQLVWVMYYHGRCREKQAEGRKITDFLKKALLSAYSYKTFYGGRGPEIYKQNGLIYRNLATNAKGGKLVVNFEVFSGQEVITHAKGRCPEILFYHSYEGGLIV